MALVQSLGSHAVPRSKRQAPPGGKQWVTLWSLPLGDSVSGQRPLWWFAAQWELRCMIWARNNRITCPLNTALTVYTRLRPVWGLWFTVGISFTPHTCVFLLETVRIPSRHKPVGDILSIMVTVTVTVTSKWHQTSQQEAAPAAYQTYSKPNAGLPAGQELFLFQRSLRKARSLDDDADSSCQMLLYATTSLLSGSLQCM